MAAVIGSIKVPIFARLNGVEYPIGEFVLDVTANGANLGPVEEFLERNG